MTAIDPCPRCAGACEAVRGPVPSRWGVRCRKCDLWADDRKETEAEAIAAWNARALPAVSAPDVAGLMIDDDLIRRGDALAACDDLSSRLEIEQLPAALPAVSAPVAVRVKPLEFRDELGDGVLTSRETGELFRIFPQKHGGFCAPKLPEPELYADDAQTLIDRLNARWAARIMAAIDAPAAAELVEAAKGIIPLVDCDVAGEPDNQSIGWHQDGKPIPVTFGQVRAFFAALARIGGQ